LGSFIVGDEAFNDFLVEETINLVFFEITVRYTDTVLIILTLISQKSKHQQF